MAKNKKSFFERLTGSIKVEEYDDADNALRADEKSQNGQSISAEEPESGQLAVDVFQNQDSIVIKAMVAGVRPDSLDISITRDMVTIKGTREETREINDEDYFFKELFWGTFSRTILLPQEVEVEEAEATEVNGLLTIKLPKVDKGRQTKLKVKSL